MATEFESIDQGQETEQGSSASGTLGPERVMTVLEQLVYAETPPTHGDLASALGIAKSTLTSLLRSLQRIGYVEVVDKRYVPGTRLLALAHHLIPRTNQHDKLRKTLLPILEKLAASSGETVTLAVEIGGTPYRLGSLLAIAHVESPSPIRFVPGIGEPRPMTSSMAGRAMLAFSKRSFVESSLDAGHWKRELETVRELGYALTSSADIHLNVIAAPVLDTHDAPIAAISVFGPSFRMTQPIDVIWPLLREATREAQQAIKNAALQK